MNKTNFEEALAIGFDLRRCFEAEWTENEYSITPEEAIWLFKLVNDGNGRVKLSDLKDILKERYRFQEFKKIEVKLSKKLKIFLDKGLITKSKEPSDQREIIIQATNKGMLVVDDFLKRARARWERG